ncbi:helix-turn-helix domain-containing protein [Cerasicoccus frondis]|uniref:helix-turn-helix domain-containing protein n=1 Tax=Cerasicoccus frondis TaxID=490090 RepID=UPI003CCE4E31
MDINHPKHDTTNTNLRPEFLRIPDAVRYSGLSRSTLYQLLSTGEIKSFALRKRGNARGIRLVSVDSLNAYLRQEFNLQQEEGGQE